MLSSNNKAQSIMTHLCFPTANTRHLPSLDEFHSMWRCNASPFVPAQVNRSDSVCPAVRLSFLDPFYNLVEDEQSHASICQVQLFIFICGAQGTALTQNRDDVFYWRKQTVVTITHP